MIQRIKITGGLAKGKTIGSFEGDRTRPTSSMVRQAIFNIIGPVKGLSFLDLFGGTGSVGLEALSRGASDVCWVESHASTAKLINENLSSLKLGTGKVHCAKVQNFLSENSKGFDIIFIDPPFTEDYPVDLDLSKVQKENGVIIWQFPSKVNIQWKVKPFKIYKYGESSLAINYCEV